MKNTKKQKHRLNYFRVAVAALLIIIIIIGFILIAISCSDNAGSDLPASINTTQPDSAVVGETAAATTEPPTEKPEVLVEYPVKTETTDGLPIKYTPKYFIMIDNETNEIVAYRNYNTIAPPASLTKIMTLIVTVENTTDFNDTVLITDEMIAPMIEQEASRAGFCAGETPTIEQLLYGIALPSGADASIAAAQYVAGSEEAFVEMMNRKADEMGLKNTHFTNVVGLHDDKHYSTAEDMALILKYALENETCRKVLSTYQYQIPPTEFNPEGILLTSTMFSRMEGTEMPSVVIKGGKTGYTDQAGNCLASYAEINGKEYIMVLMGETTQWNAIYDTLSCYSVFGAGGEDYVPPTDIDEY